MEIRGTGETTWGVCGWDCKYITYPLALPFTKQCCVSIYLSYHSSRRHLHFLSGSVFRFSLSIHEPRKKSKRKSNIFPFLVTTGIHSTPPPLASQQQALLIHYHHHPIQPRARLRLRRILHRRSRRMDSLEPHPLLKQILFPRNSRIRAEKGRISRGIVGEGERVDC